jgi:hypothetical protein
MVRSAKDVGAEVWTRWLRELGWPAPPQHRRLPARDLRSRTHAPADGMHVTGFWNLSRGWGHTITVLPTITSTLAAAKLARSAAVA